MFFNVILGKNQDFRSDFKSLVVIVELLKAFSWNEPSAVVEDTVKTAYERDRFASGAIVQLRRRRSKQIEIDFPLVVTSYPVAIFRRRSKRGK